MNSPNSQSGAGPQPGGSRSDDLRQRVSALLKARGIKQGELARKLDIRPGTFSAFMKQRTGSMRKETMDRLAGAVTMLENQDKIVSIRSGDSVATVLDMPDFSPLFTSSDVAEAESDPVREGTRQEIRRELAQVLANGDPSFEAGLRALSDIGLMQLYAKYLVLIETRAE